MDRIVTNEFKIERRGMGGYVVHRKVRHKHSLVFKKRSYDSWEVIGVDGKLGGNTQRVFRTMNEAESYVTKLMSRLNTYLPF